jgi:hypothetical protein
MTNKPKKYFVTNNLSSAARILESGFDIEEIKIETKHNGTTLVSSIWVTDDDESRKEAILRSLGPVGQNGVSPYEATEEELKTVTNCEVIPIEYNVEPHQVKDQLDLTNIVIELAKTQGLKLVEQFDHNGRKLKFVRKSILDLAK